MIFKSQYCFASEAEIFMKFETYIQKVVKNHQMILHKDPCTDARTQGVSVCARVSSRQNTRPYVYVSCTDLYEKLFDDSLLPYEDKSHKDLSFRCGDICKTILTFRNHQFSMYFAYFHISVPPKSSWPCCSS